MLRSMVLTSILTAVLLGVFGTFDTTNEIIAAKSSGKDLRQIPSEPTDFPSDDPNLVKVDVVIAKKDKIGNYHVKGEIKNLGNDGLQNVQK